MCIDRLMKCEALQNVDDMSVQRANSFIEQPSTVSSHTLRTLQQWQWNKPNRLLLRKVHKHIDDILLMSNGRYSVYLELSSDNTEL